MTADYFGMASFDDFSVPRLLLYYGNVQLIQWLALFWWMVAAACCLLFFAPLLLDASEKLGKANSFSM